MGFINERISEEDLKKFGIEEINKRYATINSDWTIDRAKNIYLRQVRCGREDRFNEFVFNLYWKGTLLQVDLGVVGSGKGWAKWGLRKISGVGFLCRDDKAAKEVGDVLSTHRSEIIAELKEALITYKDGGVFSSNGELSIEFDF